MISRLLRRILIANFVCVVFILYLAGSFLLGNYSTRKLSTIYMHIFPKAFPKIMTSQTPMRRVFDVNCAAIVANDAQEILKAQTISMSTSFRRKAISDEDYILLTSDCVVFKLQRGYCDYKVTPEEEEFPIAFSILLYKQVEQAERLLRAIYRPHNVYCIHVDADSTPQVHTAVDGIANCFPNVFVVSRKEFVVYAGFSRLQADLNCMENLLQRGKTWKYFINLPSQQFPIKTNAEIVKILKVYNGANDIEGKIGTNRIDSRFSWSHSYKYVKEGVKPEIFITNHKKDAPPYNITIIKGGAYGIFSRKFVEYVCEDKVAHALLHYIRDIYSPDEYYWATLNHNRHIGAPGSYSGDPGTKPWMSVYVVWALSEKCEGKFVHEVCIFGVGDIHKLVDRPQLFVNKFYIDYQPLAMECMEEWFFNRSLADSGSKLNLTFYKSLPFIHR